MRVVTSSTEPVRTHQPPVGTGIEWLVDATGCPSTALTDVGALERLFAAIVDAAALTPVGPATWHRFPDTGGITGVLLLSESHLTCHTFPEHGSLCLDLFCCRPRPDWRPDRLLKAHMGAAAVDVRTCNRQFAPRPEER